MATTVKPPKRRRAAGDVMSWLLVLGVLLTIVGFSIAATNWPGSTTEYDPFLNDTRSVGTGDSDMTALGLGLGGIGTLFAQVWAVAWGVSLGTRHRDEMRGQL